MGQLVREHGGAGAVVQRSHEVRHVRYLARREPAGAERVGGPIDRWPSSDGDP
ncbi:MAG TPA: hypothetical protein VGD70_07195 [Actinophytocola sp.]